MSEREKDPRIMESKTVLGEKAQLNLTPVVPDIPEYLAVREFVSSSIMNVLGRSHALPISLFSEAALRRVGKAWTEELVRKAKQMRELAKIQEARNAAEKEAYAEKRWREKRQEREQAS